MSKKCIQNSSSPKNNQLQLISQSFIELSNTSNITGTYNTILKNYLRLIKSAKIVFLLQLQQETQQLELKSAAGIDLNYVKKFAVDIGTSKSGKVINSCCKEIVVDINKNSEFIFEEVLAKRHIRTLLIIPLKVFNRIIGVINLYLTSKYQAATYDAILDIVSNQAAFALHNNMLTEQCSKIYEIAEIKTKQFITLREINEALSQQKSLTEILNIIAVESLNIAGHGQKVAFVMLLDKQRKLLITRSAYGELFEEEHLNFQIPLHRKSIVTYVAKTRKPKITSNVYKDPRYLKIIPSAKSEICIPILFRDEVVGVINIESSELNAFSNQDLQLLQTLADNASVATKIAELYDIRIKQLEALQNTGTKISSSLKLKEVMYTIAREALIAIGPKNRTIYVQLLRDDNTFLTEVACGTNPEINYIGSVISINEGISGWVNNNRKHYLCSNVNIDKYYVEINQNVKSELCVPIMFADKVIGLINVESNDENDFGEHEIYLLQGLANQAGVAIENAKLNERIADTQFQLTRALELTVIGETLAGLTHDIRTCSSLISGEAQWFEHRYDRNKISLGEAVEAMKKIRIHVERIDKLTKDLAKRSQQSPIVFEKANIADLIKECIYLFSRQAQANSVKIEIDYQSFYSLAEVDQRRLKRVFLNIILNAIEAMSNGGTLTIHLREFNDYMEIIFIDTGEGISKDDIKNIWDTFFTTKKEGSGLGLAVCKRIIEKDHNGEISAFSEHGQGTTLRIKLPLKQNMKDGD